MPEDNKNNGKEFNERSASAGQAPEGAARRNPSEWQKKWDKLVCRRTVNQWRRRRKRQAWLKKFWHRAMNISVVAELGEFTYIMGFWAEYVARLSIRALCSGAILLRQECGKIFRMRVMPVLELIQGFFADVFSPIVECVIAVRRLHQLRKKAAGKGIWRYLKPGYVLSGITHYAVVLLRGISCLLPFAAAAVFVFTVRSVLNYDYVLAVQIDGKTVGYVASEQIFDDARMNVNERIEQAQETMAAMGTASEDQQWEINPTFTLRVANGSVMDENEMADAVLRASSDQIQEATALYVDGSLRAITTQGDDLRRFLDDFKKPYEDPNDMNLRVEFVRNIELIDGVYFTDSIMDYGDILNMLQGKEQEEEVYTVQSGDTPWMIAAVNDLTLNELYELNPEMTESDYNMYVGDQLIVAQEVDFLQVKQITTRTWQEEIPYETNTTNSDEYDYGVTKTLVEGQNGVKEITADITYIDGVQISTEILQETVLSEPVTEEVVKGTHLKSGMVAQYGTGTFIWPVPNYKYVSRWMGNGHKGADICAAYGTPIIASDSGVVTTAATHYSYGNYVVINHGNGYSTLYAHMAYFPSVSAGQSVSQGQIIGYVGSTGNSTGNHCHFEMYYNGVRFSARSVFPGM